MCKYKNVWTNTGSKNIAFVSNVPQDNNYIEGGYIVNDNDICIGEIHQFQHGTLIFLGEHVSEPKRWFHNWDKAIDEIIRVNS